MDRRIKELKLAEMVEKIAEKDFQQAEKIVNSLEDREAKIYGLLTLFRVSGKDGYLQSAINIAETDEDYLSIIENSCKPLNELAEKIKSSYRRDLAFCTLLEKTCDLNYAAKVNNLRLLSASLKRVALKKSYPENLRVARMIPDPYYRAITLAEISEREGLNLKDEILCTASLVESENLRQFLFRKLSKSDV